MAKEIVTRKCGLDASPGAGRNGAPDALLLQFENIAFGFGETVLFTDFNARIFADDCIALVGRSEILEVAFNCPFGRCPVLVEHTQNRMELAI